MDKIGGWQDNAFIYSIDKACSTLISKWPESWKIFMQYTNISADSCPIKPVSTVIFL